MRIPATALLLAIAGLIPFLASALIILGIGGTSPDTLAQFLPREGTLLMARYGLIILCFMSGALWGFATKPGGPRAAFAYLVSVLPALWTLLSPGTTADEALINLMIGFGALLLLDYAFHRWELAPPWWLSLRIPLTVVVLICLAIGVWA